MCPSSHFLILQAVAHNISKYQKSEKIKSFEILPRKSSVVVKMLVVDHVTGSDVVKRQCVAFSVPQILKMVFSLKVDNKNITLNRFVSENSSK